MPRDQEAYRQSCEREETLKSALQVTDDAQYKRFLSTIPLDVLRKITGSAGSLPKTAFHQRAGSPS